MDTRTDIFRCIDAWAGPLAHLQVAGELLQKTGLGLSRLSADMDERMAPVLIDGGTGDETNVGAWPAERLVKATVYGWRTHAQHLQYHSVLRRSTNPNAYIPETDVQYLPMVTPLNAIRKCREYEMKKQRGPRFHGINALWSTTCTTRLWHQTDCALLL